MKKLIKNVTIYTMNAQNDVLQSAELLVENGKIVQVGQQLSVQEDVEVIEGHGAIVTPGLVDIHTHVGLWGETTGDTGDGNEASNPFTPVMVGLDSINPEHISFLDARSGGVTTVQTGPGSGNPIGGIWSVIKTAGKTVDEMILRKESALKGALGENPKGLYGQRQGKTPYSRMAVANIIRDGFRRSQVLLDKGEDTLEHLYQKGNQELYPFLQVLKGHFPLRLHAHRADDIVTAIRIAKEFKVELSIEHCTEGFKVADYVHESGYPITLGPFMGAATKYETRDTNLESPKIFQELGTLVAIITDHPFVPIQYLSVAAAEAVKHGMNEMDALRSITVNPAIIGGVQDRVGSIEEGKDADFVLWSAHPFKTKARVQSTWINGQIVYSS